MKFKELMEKYKKGTATEEEKELVLQEIEKYEAIEEHLSGSFDMDFTANHEDTQKPEASLDLRKTIARRLRKEVTLAVSAALLLLFGGIYIVAPAIASRLYYDPSRVTIGTQSPDLYFDLAARMELNHPGQSLTSSVFIDRTGFGEYQISYDTRHQFTGEEDRVSHTVRRGKPVGGISDYFMESDFKFLSLRSPEHFNTPELIAIQKERVLDHINELSPVAYVSASLTFEEDLTMEELHELESAYPGLRIIWAGIRTSAPGEPARDLTGFRLDHDTSFPSTDKPDDIKYPAFYFFEWMIRNNPGAQAKSYWPEGYRLHYTSLLRYMTDRKEAVGALELPEKSDYYKSALDYVEEHGVMAFGVVVYGNAQALREFIENESISTLEVDQILASRRYIN